MSTGLLRAPYPCRLWCHDRIEPRSIIPARFGPCTQRRRTRTLTIWPFGIADTDANGSLDERLTGHIDEADDHPITAVDTGSVAQMTARTYDDAGQELQEDRQYFSIPSAYPGTEGTHYDATAYGYDDAGRQWRVKEPSGTIRRTVYDDYGRRAESWIGTNDSGFDGGEPSGTDDMVKTEALEYDSGADDGNGHLTKRTAYVEGSDTDKRETSYSHDLRGNVLLVTNATAPHVFEKLDSMGRTVAVGKFSSTANIVVGTDDPTTETSNRMALDETYYDELGRVWRTVRHKIDQDDGSDDDTLEALTWYDSTGRTIKVDGETLSKSFYDRLGRRTHEFVLAKARDSGGSIETAYADADDVAFDWVLEEQQTTYASSDDDAVVMSATISRHHDDLSNGTVGALDTNADGDQLLYTAADVAGRIQIQASWYDDGRHPLLRDRRRRRPRPDRVRVGAANEVLARSRRRRRRGRERPGHDLHPRDDQGDLGGGLEDRDGAPAPGSGLPGFRRGFGHGDVRLQRPIPGDLEEGPGRERHRGRLR